MRYRTATSNFHSMCPTPWDWKAWINWNPPLKTMSQAMTTTTPHDVANGSAMARKPKTMSRIAHTIDFPEPRLERPAGVISCIPPCDKLTATLNEDLLQSVILSKRRASIGFCTTRQHLTSAGQHSASQGWQGKPCASAPA